MEIKTFEDHHFKPLRIELNTAIASTLTKYGLTHELGAIRYSATECTVKLTLRTKQIPATVHIGDLRANSIKPSTEETQPIIPGFHNDFIFRGSNYVVVGYKERNHKYPVLAQKKYGQRGPGYKFPLEALNPIV